MVNCLECEGPIEVAADLKVNEIIECRECQAELEVLSLDPVTVALAPEVEEDWGE